MGSEEGVEPRETGAEREEEKEVVRCGDGSVASVKSRPVHFFFFLSGRDSLVWSGVVPG